jgi:hypothetical protein
VDAIRDMVRHMTSLLDVLAKCEKAGSITPDMKERISAFEK